VTSKGRRGGPSSLVPARAGESIGILRSVSRRSLIPVAALLAAVLAVTLTLPSSADARRKPTPRERAGVARAAGVPARCLFIRVSTVDRRYAYMRIRNRKQSCRRWWADGVVVFRKRADGRWRFLTAGSAIECPVPKVPSRVVRDLRISCVPAG